MAKTAYNDTSQYVTQQSSSLGLDTNSFVDTQSKSRNQAMQWSQKVRSLLRSSPKKNCPGCIPGYNQDFHKTHEHNHHEYSRRDNRPLTNLK